jgi:hypothetical protein
MFVRRNTGVKVCYVVKGVLQVNNKFLENKNIFFRIPKSQICCAAELF